MKLSEQIELLLKTPLKKGDKVLVKRYKFKNELYESKEVIHCDVLEDEKDGKVILQSTQNGSIRTMDVSDCERDLFEFGYNPFTKRSKSRAISYQLSSIIFSLGLDGNQRSGISLNIKGDKIKELNWNPYVMDKNGNKFYYQRGFVWSLEQKQELLESIYKGIAIGRVVIKKNDTNKVFKESDSGNDEICFHDVVDGKQRLNAISEFVQNKFCDYNGKYWDDFSRASKKTFGNYMGLSYFELYEDTTDEETLNEFLMVNHGGLEQTKEHMEFVKSIKL